MASTGKPSARKTIAQPTAKRISQSGEPPFSPGGSTGASTNEDEKASDVKKEGKGGEKKKGSALRYSSSIYSRLSVNSVQLLAEAGGMARGASTQMGWESLGEEVNFRTRELTSESAKMMKKARRNRLTSNDINLASKELNHQLMLGHRNREQPKVHFMKELKLYCRNDGTVALPPLALGPSTPPPTPTLPPRTLKLEFLSGPQSSGTEPEVRELEGRLEKVMEEFLEEGNMPGGHHPSTWTPTLLTRALPLWLRALKNELSSASPRLERVYSITASLAFSCLPTIEVRNAAESGFESLVPSLLHLGLSPAIKEWSPDLRIIFATNMGIIARHLNDFPSCNEAWIGNKCLELLWSPRRDLLIYASALSLLRNLSSLEGRGEELGEILALHYSWHQAVFDSITPFHFHDQPGSLARLLYPAAWKLLTEKLSQEILRGNSEIQSPSDWKGVEKLMKLNEDIFGAFIRVPLMSPIASTGISIFNVRKPAIVPKNSTMRSGDILKELLSSSPPKKEESPETMESPCTTPQPSKGGPGKKRKKRALEVFEVTKAFRLRHTKPGLIFVFHQTADAKVILDATTGMESLNQSGGGRSSVSGEGSELGRWWRPLRDKGLFTAKRPGHKSSSESRCLKVSGPLDLAEHVL